MKVTFPKTPPVGLAIAIDGQEYLLVEVEPHVRLDGQETALLAWRSGCADCGVDFITRSPVHSLPGGKRCDAHKRPGQKVPRVTAMYDAAEGDE